MAQGPWDKYQAQEPSGPWERYGTQVKQAPPGYGNLGPQSDVNLQKSQLDVQQTAATMTAKEQEAKAQAQSAKIKAAQDQEQWNINHPSASGAEGLSGPAYMQFLQKSDPGRAAYIQGLAEGRVPFPGGQMMRSPAGQALLTQVMRADPTIDATNYTTRAAARKNAATGNLSQSDNALTTAVGHAARLATLVPEVFGSSVQPFNSVANAVQGGLMGGKQPAYDQNASLLGDEIAKVYGGGAQGDRQGAANQFSSSLSTPQKNDNIRGSIDLMLSKLAANRAQFAYGNGGLGKPDFMLLPQNVRDELKQAGATDLAQRYFAGVPVMGAKGDIQPPDAGGGITPPPTGPAGTIGPSSNGVSDSPDPKSEAFWEGAARQGTPYIAALRQWQQSLPPGASSTPPDPKAYAGVVAYMAKNPNVDYHPVQGILRHPLSTAAAVMNDVAQNPAGAFAGHYYNNLSLGLPARLAGDKGALFNTVSDQQNPKASLLGDTLGMVGSASLASKGVGAIADAGEGVPILGKYLRGIGVNPAPGLTGEEARLAQTQAAIRRNITGDMVSTGTTGANNNPDHPVLGAAANMAAVSLGNLAGNKILGPALGWLGDTAPGQAVVNAGRNMATVPQSLGGMLTGKGLPRKGQYPITPFMPPEAPNVSLSGATQKSIPDITGKLQQAQDAGLPYMIADADPRLRSMLGSATRFSPDVQAKAEGILQPRQAGQGERAIAQINQNLAPVGDVPTIQAGILKSAQSTSRPLYEAAKAQPVPELTAYPKFKEILDRPAGQSAMRSGYETALNKGEDVGTLTYATDPQGNPVQYGNPSWNVIHYARQALDKSGDTDVRQALDKQISLINPGFKKADAAYSTTLKGSDALQAGVDATGIKVTPEATQRAMAGFPNNGPQFQQGYASNMADQIQQQRFSGNPYNLVNGSMGQQAKLGMVFPSGAQGFNTAHALEGDMNKTYQSVIGGSATQPRAMADKAFSLGDMADFGVDAGVAAATGNPASLGMLFLRKGIDKAKYGMDRQKAEAVAPFLMNPNPSANLAALSQWAQQNAARKAYLNQAGNLGGQMGVGLLGAPAISWASQN